MRVLPLVFDVARVENMWRMEMAQILQKLRLKENAHYFKEGIAKVLGKTPKFGIGIKELAQYCEKSKLGKFCRG
jgi:hypothetical protein